MKPLFLEPVFVDKIWGGTKLKDTFNYEIPTNTIGECWGISAHPNGDCKITNGEFKGKTLSYLWSNARELFDNTPGEKFPLLTKILDANDNLSVQVHPDDSYANTYENGELGKTECWYVLDCDDGAELIMGHNANSKEELKNMIDNRQWSKLLKKVKIKKGDFFYVPSGTIHALGKGSLILETQQNSDTTYRVYDFDRTDSNGNTRELHIDKSIDVSQTPHIENNSDFSIFESNNYKCTTFISNNFFSVYKLDIFKEVKFSHSLPFSLYTVINGSGTLRCNFENKIYNLEKGNHFILPCNINQFELNGELELICSHI